MNMQASAGALGHTSIGQIAVYKHALIGPASSEMVS